MKKILLTGATGFIGSNILNELSKEFKITILIRKKKLINNKINKIYFNNLKQLDKLLKKKKFDIIIHCATLYKKEHAIEDISEMIEANLHLGNKILENCNNLKCKKFINFTSVWENYNGIKKNPPNLYSVQKIAFTELMNFYKKKYKYTKFYNLYLSQTFGENDRREKLFNVLKENYKNSKVTNLASSIFHMNLLNVSDVVSAVKILINKNILSGSYGVINFKTTDVVKLIQNFNKIKEKKIKYKIISDKIIKEKNIKYGTIPGWKPKNSSVKDMINYLDG